jgi:hydroxymethylglutaryl-CoA reductase
MTPAERLEAVARQAGLDSQMVASLKAAASGQIELADRLVENAISTMAIPVGIATNMIVDGRDVLVPMATEESSVIAAVCNAAKRCRSTGGFSTSTSGPIMAAQIQLLGASDPENVRLKVLERIEEIRTICDETDPLLVRFGGGFRDLDVRVIETAEGPMTIVHILVDTRDAMGANAVNTMAEALAPKLAEWTGARTLLRILSNLADRRVARARAVWPLDEIGGPQVRDDILSAYHFADADPYRAATHNKGIMNGVSAVVLATGNDTRAVEAGAHAYAARHGRYRSMSRWEKDRDGNLVGILEMPMAVGLIGGATKIHPTAQANLKVLGVTTADALARIIVSVGLAQNFAALRALATTGIQKGHMALHAQNVALMVGAVGEEIDAVASELKALGKVRQDLAEEILAKLRAGK